MEPAGSTGSPPEWTMDELIERVRKVLARTGGAGQPKGTVSEIPDARTIRYYISLGLVDGPRGKRGTFSLYSTKHLYQILAIKKLQQQHFPVRKILEYLEGKDADALREVIGEDLELDPLAGRPAAPPPTPGPTPRTWVRHELRPGIEVHIEQGIEPAPSEVRQILDELARILSSRPTDR